ncbi:LysR family transcriptional regulator [Agrobacterium rhizogenes]|uniref:LysR family transcriptional regulator n=1 Tax=Rhizobium rhizogenes TaxID=359 RepID=UPI00115CC81A|nr:LysR family transcriptional regulator [Rhizobium rhizogenes]NTG05267.1 LysR family transcriptional regulator [Rhizobium rhizogenes]NTG11853.1 LysR family transcriptional regulator [Rhizobium rhizogenes]NTG16369.1 LysR family transcriptional regulator [Rhizobium rhizogenes]NTG23310.1 LysR family transcriptional regulator [Rhizobium rhizogenes]NTG32393.1 LysR family transcriptional regulator [Rhizobium rhizogenes]
MEFSQLRHFVALTEVLHFGRCAQQLGIAQPHLSRSIASLEAELEVRLFERTSRRVELTTAGKAFLGEAFEVLRGQQRAINAARAANRKDRETLRIGFVSSATFRVLPEAVRQMRALMDVHVEFLEQTTNDQIAFLQSGNLDIGLGHPPITAGNRIVVDILRPDGYDVLFYEGHPMASYNSVSFEQIAGEPFVLFPEIEGPVFYNRFRELCRRSGKEMNVSHVASRMHTIHSLVSAGMGIGFAPLHTKSIQVDGIVRVPLTPYPEALKLDLAAFYDRLNRKQSLKLFLKIAQGV